MSKHYLSLWLLSLMLLLSGCAGKQAGKTMASMTLVSGISGSSISDMSDGGAILYGFSRTDNQSFGKVISLTSNNSMELLNGDWDFYAFAWQLNYAGDPQLSGKVRCAMVENLKLSGTATAVNLVLNNSNCTHPKFGKFNPTGNGAVFAPVKIHTCRELSSATGTDSNCRNDFDGPVAKHKQGYASSYRIVLPSFIKPKDAPTPIITPGNALISECMPMTAAGYAMSSSTNIPTGDNTTPFLTILTGFMASNDCEDTTPAKGFIETKYPQGMGEPGPGSKNFFPGTGPFTLSLFHLTSDEATCDATRVLGNGTTPHPFAAGTAGIIEYAICTKEQLNNLGRFMFPVPLTGIAFTENYRLLKDIDFREDNSNVNAEPMLFTMLGPAIDDPGYNDPSGNGFQGTFYGNHKTIKSLHIDDKEYSDLGLIATSTKYIGMGFFRVLSAGSKVLDLNFLAPRVRVSKVGHEVGVLAGQAFAGSGGSVTIRNVNVDWGEVEGIVKVGGLLGSAEGHNSDSTKYVKIEDSHVRGLDLRGGNKAGGLVGYYNYPGTDAIMRSSADLKKIRMERIHSGLCMKDFLSAAGGTCTSAYSWNDANMLCQKTGVTDPTACTGTDKWLEDDMAGGLIGMAENCYNAFIINQSKSQGHIFGNTRLGGLMGAMKALSGTHKCKIIDSYSTAHIQARGVGMPIGYARVGGIVGQIMPTSPSLSLTLQRTFHTQGGLTGTSSTDFSINGFLGEIEGAYVITCTDSFAGAPTAIGGCTSTTKNYTELRTQATYTNFDFTNVWTMADPGYDFPRLKWEEARDCQGKHATLLAGGSGTAADPYQICNRDQFAQINNYSTSHFELMQDIDLLPTTPGIISVIPNAFSGSLEGNGHAISNINILKSCSGNVALGLFHTLNASAIISNLNIFNSKIDSTNCDYIGHLAAYNNGLVEDVNVYGGMAKGREYVGGIIGNNLGLLTGSYSKAFIKAYGMVGGTVGYNQGGILDYVESSAVIVPISGATETAHIGGLVGKNSTGSAVTFINKNGETITGNGLIQRSQSYTSIQVQFAPNYPNGIGRIGGLVGLMTSGELTDVNATGRIEDRNAVYTSPSDYPLAKSVGKLIGKYDGGNITRAVAATRLEYDTGTIDDFYSWKTIVGEAGSWANFNKVIVIGQTGQPGSITQQHTSVTNGKQINEGMSVPGYAGYLGEYTDANYDFDITNNDMNDGYLWMLSGNYGPSINMHEYFGAEEREFYQDLLGF